MPLIHLGGALISSGQEVQDHRVDFWQRPISYITPDMLSCLSSPPQNWRKVRPHLDKHTTEILMHSFVSSLLDNCKCLLILIPTKDIIKLQTFRTLSSVLYLSCQNVNTLSPSLESGCGLLTDSNTNFILVIFNSIHGTCPHDFTKPYAPSRSLHSSSPY